MKTKNLFVIYSPHADKKSGDVSHAAKHFWLHRKTVLQHFSETKHKVAPRSSSD